MEWSFPWFLTFGVGDKNAIMYEIIIFLIAYTVQQTDTKCLVIVTHIILCCGTGPFPSSKIRTGNYEIYYVLIIYIFCFLFLNLKHTPCEIHQAAYIRKMEH